jgi:Phage tail tube protein
MPNFRFSDTVFGSSAKATAIIDGQVIDMFYLTSLEATAEKNKEEGRILGRRSISHKSAGWTGTGSLEMYYCTSQFRKLMKEYCQNGRDAYFTITVETEDAASTIGKQTTTLFNVNLNSVLVAKIAVEDAALTESVDFTFEDWDLLEEFTAPTTV